MLPCRPVRSNAQCRELYKGTQVSWVGVALSKPQSDFMCGGAVTLIASSRGLWRDLFYASSPTFFSCAG